MEGGKCDSVRSRKRRVEEIIPSTRVLRSHKRKLAQLAESIDTNVLEIKKKSVSSDASDCIIIGDSQPVTHTAQVNKFVTSTPIRQGPQKMPNFDGSCIKQSQNDHPDNSIDVIVISDSSATVPVIVLSDGDESDVEMVLPAKDKSMSIQTNVETADRNKKVLRDTINNENHQCSTSTYVQPKKIAKRTKFKSKRYRSDKRHRMYDRPGKYIPKHRNPFNFGENIYVEKPIVLPQTGLRPIIIDGSNVAFHHSNNTYFSCKGLEICIKYFKTRGHEVIAFVPHYRLKQNESDNPKLLDLLVKTGDVVLTPSRKVNGSLIVSYDDRFIVQTAVIKGGIIVTRDNYRDLLDENPLWAETIKYRLLQFTWVQDLLMFPKDPLGKRGPSLEQFLRFD